MSRLVILSRQYKWEVVGIYLT